MGYTNRTPDSEPSGASQGPQGPQSREDLQGLQGLQGEKGIGFKLDPDNNFNLDDKKILNLDVMVDYKPDDPYEYRVKDLKSAVNKEYLDENFLKKDARGKYFDLKGNVIKNSEPYYNDLYDDNDLVSKRYVDVQNAKQDFAINDKANKGDVIHHDGSGNLDMKNHTITGVRSSSRDNSAATLGDVKSLFLPRDGSRQMSGNLNMGGNTLTNIKPFVKDDNVNQSGQAIDFSFFHAQRGELKRLI